jgi:hypothetical protein
VKKKEGRSMKSRILRVVVPAIVVVGLLGGCTYQGPEMRGAVLGADRTVEYPNGRWQLNGDGSSASPYYYVWLPGGSTTYPPPPPRHPYP